MRPALHSLQSSPRSVPPRTLGGGRSHPEPLAVLTLRMDVLYPLLSSSSPPRRRGISAFAWEDRRRPLPSLKDTASNILGYVSNTLHIYGYYVLQADKVGALVSFSSSPTANTGYFLQTVNGPSSDFLYSGEGEEYPQFIDANAHRLCSFDVEFPYRRSGRAGKNTEALVGTSPASAGSSTTGSNTFATDHAGYQYYETVIWSYNSATSALISQWTTSDGNPALTFVHFNTHN
ncbi:hypothetical protein DFH09DRAFT_1347147 [Mycena vulgaris]|nr:hypothetical protein DFH09DRAFT_1347147 [Mycena vulgaris]